MNLSTFMKSVKEHMAVHDPRTLNTPEDYTAAEAGHSRIGRSGPEWERRVAEAAELLANVKTGRWGTHRLKEAMTTSDFPLLFGDLLYRQMLGNYQPYPVTYPGYFRIVEVNDFRKINMYAIDGGTSRLTAVGEKEPYPEIKFAETRYQLQVAKYGRRYGISWEMTINDDLNAFNDRPMMMAQGARRSEELLAAQQLVDANGPHASFFTSGNKNIVTSNPALSLAALQTAMGVLGNQVDADGEPIVINTVTLVVGNQSLYITAQNILNAVQLELLEAGGTSNQKIWAQNWMKGKFNIVVNPYIPLIATTKTNSWFLVADPNDVTTRPAFAFGFLRGYRQPSIFVKSPNAMSISGGDVSPASGDFDTDSIDYKLRHVFGATQVDPKMAVASSVA